MTEQVAQRGAMVCSFRAGKTNIEIATFNNIPHGTVRNFRMTFNKFLEDGGKEEEFDITNKKRKRRSDAHDDQGPRTFGLLARRILIPWTFLCAAWLRGTQIGPLITPSSP